MTAQRPVSLAVAALGGQGGGVVADWLVAAARHAGYIAQATSVPGVAQRTGATIYYLEFFPKSALPANGNEPVMALLPSPGDVDIVVASELMEAGRAMARGIVTRDRTTLIASTHRDYTISEKSAPGDGRASSGQIIDAARLQAKKLILLDMEAIAAASGSRISAVTLGALAGSGALPLSLEHLRAAIEASGISVAANLAGFDAAIKAVRAGEQPIAWPADAAMRNKLGSAHAAACIALPADLRAQIEKLPELAQGVAAVGAARLLDYQDREYARQYLDVIAKFAPLEPAAGHEPLLLMGVARGLALWMSFEDVFRVADLKTRAERSDEIRAEVRAAPGELLYISEFVKPRVEEICGSLPKSLGNFLLHSPRCRRVLSRWTEGRRIETSKVGGFLMLRIMASLRRFRRGTQRFAVESAHIDSWLALVRNAAATDYPLAVQIAACQSLVKGYGETHERGWSSFATVTEAGMRLIGRPGAADTVAQLRQAAMADEFGGGIR